MSKRKHSEITKKKISIGHLGLRVSEETKKKMSLAHKGKKYKPMSVIGRLNISLSQKRPRPWRRGKVSPYKGEKHHWWKGGLTSLNDKIRRSTKYKNWRKSVFERDNFTCILCHKKGVKLNADHIKPFAHFPKLRFELSNGRTLCIDCYRLTDTFGHKWKYKVKKLLAEIKLKIEELEKLVN